MAKFSFNRSMWEDTQPPTPHYLNTKMHFKPYYFIAGTIIKMNHKNLNIFLLLIISNAV